MAEYPRFSIAERRKLTMSRRATESFRTIGIRGGAAPSQGVPTPGMDYYQLSDDDRALIEQVIADNQSADANRQQTAIDHWNAALEIAAPRFGPAALSLYIAGKLTPLVLDLLGIKVAQDFDLGDTAGGVTGSTNSYAAVLSGFSVGAYNAIAGTVDVTWSGAFSLKPGGWSCSTFTIFSGTFTRYSMESMCFSVQGAGSESFLSSVGDAGNSCSIGEVDVEGDQSNLITGICPDPRGFPPVSDITGAVFDGPVGGTARFTAGENACFYVSITDDSGEHRSSTICVGDDAFDPALTPGILAPVAPSTPADFALTPDELADLLDALKDYPYAPEPGSPVGTPPGGIPTDIPPIDPSTGLPPGTVPDQPPDPGANPGPGEGIPEVPGGVPGDPGLPPGDPGLPTTPDVPPGPETPAPGTPITDPIESGIEDPLDGGCNTLAGEPSGFRDPAQPGGISRKFQPGQPVTIDYGAGSTCRVKITRVKQDKDLASGEKGTELCVSPTIDNGGTTTEKTCYGPGPVTEAISSVLGEMIAEGGQVIFDSDCTRELTRPLCFRAGTSKRVILNKLLDMCGFCVFPLFDCNVIVGYCGPVNIHWTYHEDVDLLAFDVEYDNLETYDYVQVFRGDKMNQSGQILEPGGDIFYPVGAPASSVGGDRVFQYEVPYGTSQADMLGIAMELAAKYRLQAMPLVAFGVPLNSQLLPRHQIHFKRPSLGFSATYMVTRIVRDYDRENGHLSTGLARWLSGS